MNEIEESMIKVQQWKIYPVYFCGKNMMLSQELMQLLSIQFSKENMGLPLSKGILEKCLQIIDDRCVTPIISFSMYSI
jgi:hypothetical protein